MNRDSILIRVDDGKEFRVVDLAHWSTIRSADGEEYEVKWYGPGWVGREGPIFVMKEEPK